MSAWPQAVWLSKQLKREIQINIEQLSTVEEYQEELKTWEDQLDTKETVLNNMQQTLDRIDSATNPPLVEPSSYSPTQSDLIQDKIWFVYED